jgi:nucleotide-binding universal stress UspA family protein
VHQVETDCHHVAGLGAGVSRPAAGGWRARNGIDIRLAVARGDAGAAILDFARESDLIVLGWRGVLEPDRARTLQRVIRDTVCPVIVFRLHP